MPISPRVQRRPPDFWTVFGHSYFQYNFGTRAQSGRADSLVRSRFDIEFNNWVNHATNGARASVDGLPQGGFARVLQNINGSQSGHPYVSMGGAYILCYGINDLGFNVDSAQMRTAFEHSMRSIISRCRMSTRRDDDYSGAAGTGVITYGAGFTNLAFTNDYSSGPTAAPNWSTLRQATTTTAATATITLPTNYNGAPVSIAFVSNAGAVGGTVTFSGTAGVTGTLSTSNIMPGAMLTRSYQVRRITNLTAANAGQTIICTVTALDAGGTVFFDGYWIESVTPPPVIVCNIAKLTATGYAVYPTAPNDSQVDTWNGVINSVVAEFDSMVQVADIDSAIDKTNFGTHAVTPTLSSDGLHPTEFGAARIADEVAKAVDRLQPTTAMGEAAHFTPQSARSAALTQPYRDAHWYTSETQNTAGTAYAGVAGDVWAIPFFVSSGQMQATQWSVEKTAQSGTAPTVFFCIFDDRQMRGYPQYIHANPANVTALSINTGINVFTSSTTAGQNGYLLQPLDPGLYWLAIKIVAIGTSFSLRTLGGQSRYMPNLSPSTGGGNVTYSGWKLTGQGSTAFSGMFPPGATATANAPYIGLKMQNLGQP